MAAAGPGPGGEERAGGEERPREAEAQAEAQAQQAQQAQQADRGSFDCNICLDSAKDAVISLCGHLFCWPCLHQWLETRPERQECPVCKASISADKVIPLYGRGSGAQHDPRLKTPPRPQGQRTEPGHRGGFQGFGDGGFHMSFGIGAFPFGFFTTVFNSSDNRQAPDRGLHPPASDWDTFFGGPRGAGVGINSNWDSLFLFIAIFFFFWLLSV